MTRQGKIFCWGKNESRMLGLREHVNKIVDQPTELDLSKMGGNASGSFSKVPGANEVQNNFSDKNPFKMKKNRGKGNSLFHEGFNRRQLVVD